MDLLSKYTDSVYVLLRIVSGALFSFHGIQKIFGFLAEHDTTFASQLWFGGLIELIGGLCIVVGFQTRFAAFLSSGTMAVAYIQFHWRFQFGPEFFPAINQGDAALLYSFVFLLIACKGGCKWCLDKMSTAKNLINKARQRKTCCMRILRRPALRLTPWRPAEYTLYPLQYTS